MRDRARRVGDEVAGERSQRARPAEELTGTVLEILPNALYRVQLASGPRLLAHAAGRIDRNFVRLLVGDRVRLERALTAGRGRIVERLD